MERNEEAYALGQRFAHMHKDPRFVRFLEGSGELKGMTPEEWSVRVMQSNAGHAFCVVKTIVDRFDNWSGE